MPVLFISIGRIPFLSSTLDIADPLFTLVLYTRFLFAPQVVEHDPVRGSLFSRKVINVM